MVDKLSKVPQFNVFKSKGVDIARVCICVTLTENVVKALREVIFCANSTEEKICIQEITMKGSTVPVL